MESMAAELEDRCPICLDSWEEASYVMPCLHRFCYPCILRWADSKPECPLCKRRVTSVLHSVRGDNDFEEYVIPPPAAPPVVHHLTGPAPGHAATHNLHHPAPSQPSSAGLGPRAPVGGLQPHIWAFVFREHPFLLQSLLFWLPEELWLIFANAWEAAAAQRLILSSLSLFGLDEETLSQRLQDVLGRHRRSFVHWLVETIVHRCGREAQHWMALVDTHAAEEREGSPAAAPGPTASQGGSPAPSPALGGGAGSTPHAPGPAASQGASPAPSPALGGGAGSPPSAPVPTHGWQEEPQGDPEEAAPGPSTPSHGSERSPAGPRRAPKRRAGSPEEPSHAPKKPPRRHP